MTKPVTPPRNGASLHARNAWDLVFLLVILGFFVFAFKIGMCK